MKSLQKLDDFRELSKDNLIEEMMIGTIKGGCCRVTAEVELPDGTVIRIWDRDVEQQEQGQLEL